MKNMVSNINVTLRYAIAANYRIYRYEGQTNILNIYMYVCMYVYIYIYIYTYIYASCI